MKIAYLLTSDTARYLGSTGKIKNQVDSWRSMGHEVEVFARTPDLEPSILESNRYVKPKSLVGSLMLVDRQLLKDMERFGPELVYIRSTVRNRTYAAVQKRFPHVIEVNTHDLDEFRFIWKREKSLRAFFRYMLAGLLRRGFYRSANGLVFISRELEKRFNSEGLVRKSIVVPNSITIDLSGNDVIKEKKSESGPIRIFFIGSPGISWHGEDKLLRLSQKLGDDYEFHIVGLTGEDTETVKFYGYLAKDEYQKILSQCHICFSTFALHRKNLHECSTIKFTEYLKAGFPVIMPYRETCLGEGVLPSFVLQIPNAEDAVEMPGVVASIDNFCRENRQVIVPPEKASDIVGSQKWEAERLAFLSASRKS